MWPKWSGQTFIEEAGVVVAAAMLMEAVVLMEWENFENHCNLI